MKSFIHAFHAVFCTLLGMAIVALFMDANMSSHVSLHDVRLTT